VIVYAESSAVLSWLLGEASAPVVRQELASAELVLTSELTAVECRRGLVRAVKAGRLREGVAADRAARLLAVNSEWNQIKFELPILERAGAPFPVEPVGTLDAIHLSSALTARASLGPVAMLSLDHSVRQVAAALGFDLLPGTITQ
jgi:hypothetical protein